MTTSILITIPFGVLIGLAVGMVGGGGAVLAVPVLVYLAGLDVHEATTTSLAIVAAAAFTGTVGQARRGAVCWRSAAWFAAAAAIGSLGGALANRAVGGDVLLLIFSAAMLLAARATWVRAGHAIPQAVGCPDAEVRVLVPAGAAVGALTGLVGVGGGFLIVPALAIGLSFGMREAMATSMAIVTLVSLAGLASHLAAGNPLDTEVAAVMGAATVAGALAGPAVAARLSLRALGRGFTLLIVVVAAGIATATLAGASPA